MRQFSLTIATVDRNLFQGEVQSVTVPGSEGEMTILAGHTALVSTLKEGVVTVREGRKKDVQTFNLERGILEVGGNQATILL